MFYAIQTRYVGPTDTRGARIIARMGDAGDLIARKVVGYRHDLSNEGAHRAAAESLLDDAAIRGNWLRITGGGRLPDGSYAFTVTARP